MTRGIYIALVALAACSSPHGASLDAAAPLVDAAPNPCAGDAACVETTRGPVGGTFVGPLRVFEGIPYAAPPIGPLRWRPPQPATPWTAILDTTHFGAECVQLDLSTGSANGGSEDCLTLNVWAPTSAAAPLPILVFIHGGYYVQGGADTTWHGQLAYDGTTLAQGGAIVVTLQYRLGALGFLDDATLASPGDPHANYGTLDQIAALQWVKDNAAALGGDPAHVMIFGQSAGGESICQLLASPLAVGLFASAAIQSGGGCIAHTASYATTQAQLERTGLGCTDAADPAACMRAATAADAAAAISDAVTGAHRWGPTIDGTVMPAAPIDVFTAGTYTAVPTIVGNTSSEMSSQIQFYFPTLPTDATSYQADVMSQFGSNAAAIVAQYPLANYSDATTAIIAVFTDGLYVCPGRRVARALAPHGATWRYIFEHGFEAGDFPPSSTSLAPLGAYHFIDVPYVFHDVAPTDFTFAADEVALSTQLGTYFAQFAAAGDPNSNAVPAWPAFTVAGDLHEAITIPVSSIAGYRTANCDFWDGL